MSLDGPGKGFGIFVVRSDVVLDGGSQFRDAAKGIVKLTGRCPDRSGRLSWWLKQTIHTEDSVCLSAVVHADRSLLASGIGF